MDFINFCDCGKAIDESFIYCPWCGKRVREADDKEVLENVFKQLEVKQANDRNIRIKRIENQIAEIEKVLEKFIEPSVSENLKS